MASSSKVDQSGNMEKLIDLAKSKQPGWISQEDIEQVIPGLTLKELTSIINTCLKAGALELLKKKDKLLYRYKDTSKNIAVEGAASEEIVVYNIIAEAKNKGIWIRDIRNKSDLNNTQLKKVLKSLETKKLIKAVKSVAASKKKVYMLYNLEPDNSITGGAWYQDQEFESDFVNMLSDLTFKYLLRRRDEASGNAGGPLLVRNCSYVTAEEVHKFITDARLVTIPLTVKDIESILYTIVLDNNAERIASSNGSYTYRAINKFISVPGIVKTTCAICPVVHRCADTGFITPKVCKYLSDWLE